MTHYRPLQNFATAQTFAKKIAGFGTMDHWTIALPSTEVEE